MLNPDINRFLGTLLYPLCDLELVLDDPLRPFFDLWKCSEQTPDSIKKFKDEKEAVRRSAISYLEKYYSVDSYDQIYQYLDRWYLGSHMRSRYGRDMDQDVSYTLIFHRLRELTHSMISKLDGRIIFKYWENESDEGFLGGFAGHNKIHLFRSLNQMLPMDILIAIFLCEGEHIPEKSNVFFGQISITDAMLERVLSRGVAENHLHMNASTSFLTVWEDLMDMDYPQHQKDALSKLKISSSIAPSKNDLQFYAGLAHYLRLYLSVAVLYWKQYCMSDHSLFSQIRPCPSEITNPDWLREQKTAMEDHALKVFEGWEYPLIELVWKNDVFARKFSVDGSLISEWRFLVTLIKFFREQSEKAQTDAEAVPLLSGLKGMFLTYLRIKHGIFQIMVQSKTHSGLDYFQQYYTAISSAEKGAASRQQTEGCSRKELRYRRLLRGQFSTPHIRQVEFRTSFPDSQKEAVRSVRDFLLAYRAILRQDYCRYSQPEKRWIAVRPLPRVGLIFHFLKKESFTTEVCFQQEERAFHMYGQLHEQYKKQLDIFLALRTSEKYAGLDRYLVGIDVASLENAVPTWVFTDIFEDARDSRTDPFCLEECRSFQGLRFTFHAGEDFRHLLSGLRRIYETVHYLKFHAGDRIGHGLALGLSVDDWYQENPNVILPRIEALENYLWAYKMLSSYPSGTEAGDLLYLERKIKQLGKEIFCLEDGEGEKGAQYMSTEFLLDGYESMFRKPFEFRRDDICLLDGNCLSKKEHIRCAYHCQRFSEKMNEPIHYHILPQEITILKILQELMRKFISGNGIVVESNPSSNLTISSADTLHQHPLYQMTSYDCDYKDIFVCVNSDDPGVFQTNAANELGLTYMGLVERGAGREASLRWIDRLRENGTMSSFVCQTESDEQLLFELNELLKKFGEAED